VKKKSVALISGKREEKSDGILRIGNRKNRKKSKKNQKDDKKQYKKVVKKATCSLKSAIADMQKSANASWDTDQRWDEASSWDFASEGASSAKGFKKGIEEVIKVIVKVIKAVATTTLLPLILIMTCCLFIVITVLWASSDVSVSGAGKADRIENPTTDKQVIYNGLLETFEGNETAVYGVMCALMAESGCSPTATEATGKWGIGAADYTAQVNDGTVSKEEFINSTYNGVQGSRGYGIAQWSTTDRKKALYEFAESWATEKDEDFDIGGIDMQVTHLQETINTSYPSMKEALIKEKDIVAACYLWISTYEKPSEKYSTWQEKAELDVEKFEEDLRAECSVNASQGIFLWPCPSSNHITSYFGNRTPPKQGASSDHKGIDIGASMGAQVSAAAAGKVTTVSYNSARGYFIVVDHGSGYVTLYQHLSRQDVKVGDMVKAGQQIGAVGETGISTAPHLHFEVHVNGTPVDPLQFFE
jgi:murein DD-endopeptidase MepM/ murein hydrolase activator NlpD